KGETMASRDNYNYSEDIFADSRMSFGEHLEELRTHLWKAIFGFLLAFLLSLFIGKPVLQFIAEPVGVQLDQFYKERVAKMDESLRKGEQESQLADQPREVLLDFDRKRLTEMGFKVPEADEGKEWIEVPVRVRPLGMAIAL